MDINNNIYKKIKKIMDYLEQESDKPSLPHNYETRIWEAGYKKAMLSVKNFISNIFKQDL